MLRAFVACKDRLERLRFFEKTKVTDWATEELDTVMEILGLGHFNVNLTDQLKYMNIYSCLKLRKIA